MTIFLSTRKFSVVPLSTLSECFFLTMDESLSISSIYWNSPVELIVGAPKGDFKSCDLPPKMQPLHSARAYALFLKINNIANRTESDQ